MLMLFMYVDDLEELPCLTLTIRPWSDTVNWDSGGILSHPMERDGTVRNHGKAPCPLPRSLGLRLQHTVSGAGVHAVISQLGVCPK